jgi:hypothetical protein
MANYSSLRNASILATPVANTTLGSPTAAYGDIYLANTACIHLGTSTFASANIFPFNLNIAPETLTINVAAPAAGDDTAWLWNWATSTLPYARTEVVNSAQVNVPLYKQGTYQLNNFANEQTGAMTQRHEAHLKWIDGAGVQNLVSWAVEVGNVSFSTANINSGANTNVQRINITVPSTVTPPTLTQPSGISYNVSFANTGAYTIGGNAEGDNKTIGPLYRGSTYTFNLASSLASHPFYLTTDNGTGFVANTFVGEYTSGVTGSRNNGSVGQTTLTFTVPNNAPDTLYYQCKVHSMMRGAIIIKDLAVETNINGNYVLYFQHTHEGHKTPIEIRPIPSLVNQMCVVYDATANKFVPQDLATYVENTPSFKNKIREVAGTATLISPSGVAVVPTVLVVADVSYLPLVNNKEGDIAFDAYYDTIYVWQNNMWNNTKPTTVPTVTSNAQPNITSVGTLTDLSVSGNATISGNLTVSGTTTTINSTVVTVNDLNLVLANNASSASAANGAGITINGAGATMNYVSSSNAFTFSHKISADGSLLTSLAGANVSGQVGNATVAGTVYTAAQPNITSTGPLTGLTVSNATGVVNFTTTANVTLGAVANLHISGGSSGQFLKTDGAGTLSWAAASGGSSNAYRTMEYWDTLVVFNGSKRWYATSSFTISNVNAFLVSAPTGSSAIFRINKNGSSAATVTIAASSTSVTSSINIAMVLGDYITVDITQVGSTTPGSYLSMVFTYQ